MLNLVKLALRISSNDFDSEIQLYINDCADEMAKLGVTVATAASTDPQICTAVIAYVKWKFGQNEDADRWRDIYHEKLAQLKMMTGYTDFGEE